MQIPVDLALKINLNDDNNQVKVLNRQTSPSSEKVERIEVKSEDGVVPLK